MWKAMNGRNWHIRFIANKFQQFKICNLHSSWLIICKFICVEADSDWPHPIELMLPMPAEDTLKLNWFPPSSETTGPSWPKSKPSPSAGFLWKKGCICTWAMRTPPRCWWWAFPILLTSTWVWCCWGEGVYLLPAHPNHIPLAMAEPTRATFSGLSENPIKAAWWSIALVVNWFWYQATSDAAGILFRTFLYSALMYWVSLGFEPYLEANSGEAK